MGWMRRYRVQALPASGGPAAGEMPDAVQKLVVPIAGERTVESLRERVFGSEGRRVSVLPRDDRFAAVSPYAMWPPVVWFGVAPAVVASVLWARRCSGLRPVVFGLDRGRRDRRLAAVAASRLPPRRRRAGLPFGFLGFRVHALLFRKVQQVSVSQSPLQRRRNLAATPRPPRHRQRDVGVHRACHGETVARLHSLPGGVEPLGLALTRSAAESVVAMDPTNTGAGSGCRYNAALSR